MSNQVEITVLNEAMIDQLYEEDKTVELWGGLRFICKNGYMTAQTDAVTANRLIQEGRVLRVKLVEC